MPAQSPAHPVEPGTGRIGDDIDPQDGRGLRVLIVDDEPLMREALRDLLGDLGFTVAGSAVNGRYGIAAALALRPDVTLMDLRMPDVDGIQATSAIHAQMPDLRIVVLSAYDDPSLRRAAMDAGAHDYLVKGDRVEEMAVAIVRASHATPPG